MKDSGDSREIRGESDRRHRDSGFVWDQVCLHYLKIRCMASPCREIHQQTTFTQPPSKLTPLVSITCNLPNNARRQEDHPTSSRQEGQDL
jgi:hypothetical protein